MMSALHRLGFAFVLALLGFTATTGVSSAAALFEDRDGVLLGTGIVVVIALAVLTTVALIKHALGMDSVPPAEPGGGEHH